MFFNNFNDKEDLKRDFSIEGKNGEKPKIKDLVAIMLAQYLILIPMALIGLVIFGVILYVFTTIFLK